MKVVLSRTYKVRTGEYESMEVRGAVELDTEIDQDLGSKPEVLLQNADELLAEAMESDLRTAQRVADPDSFIHDIDPRTSRARRS